MRKLFSKFSMITLLFFIAVIIIVRIMHLNANKDVLNIFGRYYFDEKYYSSHYPEVDGDLFKHYSEKGWKENKNPNASFDNKFYMNCYLIKNKDSFNPLQDYVRKLLSFKKTYINSTQLEKAKKLENPKYYLALVAIFRDEARFLKEWIEFYRLMGVEHFYLYNHLSKDNYMEVLSPYIKEGVVDLVNVDIEPKTIRDWNNIQCSKYTELVHKVRDDVEWLIVVDTDEFLFPTQEKDLREFLPKYDTYAALSVNWRIFGTNNVKHIPSNKLLLEVLTSSDRADDRHVKTIVKPRYVNKLVNPHFPELAPGYFQVDENFQYFRGAFLPRESREFVRVNHYWSRDYDFFESTKLRRAHITGGLDDIAKQAKIDELIISEKKASSNYDGSILRFVPALRAQVFGHSK